MRLPIVAATIAAISTPAFAEHDVQTKYRTAPCTEIVAILDGDATTFDQMATQAMVWGYLLGVEGLNPDIKGDSETTLTRLRAECGKSPKTPALSLIKGFISG